MQMYSPFRHAPALFWKRKPIHLTFFVTRRCNARCPYCFYLQSKSPECDIASENPINELSLEEIQKLAPSFGRLLWLAFSGGEIFLRKDLLQISQIFYEHNKPSIMLYPTNGLMPNLIRNQIEQILAQCPKSVVVVKLSMDGLHERHDELRNTPHSFEKTLKTYELLSPLLEQYPNFELGVNTVFCADNQDHMDEIIDFVETLDYVNTHTISMIRGSLKDTHFLENIDYNKYAQAVDRLANNMKDSPSNRYRFKGAGLKAAQDVLQRRLIHRTLLEQKRQIPCYAGRTNLVMTEVGEIYPCELLTDSFGNVRDFDYDIEQVVNTSQAKNSIADIESESCFCTHECNLMTNILLNPRLLPSLAREYSAL
jgi:radical SAM protein with 4Fe4S-binding SPASM domain